jgi:catechol-2,3-dioxygenase
VADVERSVAFYRRWFGFGAEDRRFPDGTVFLRDADGTDLALHPGEAGPSPAFHFGFRRPDAADVRHLLDRLIAGQQKVLGFDDQPAIVSLKVSDPDGYVVEVYWEA